MQVLPEIVSLLDGEDAEALRFTLDFLTLSLRKPPGSQAGAGSEKWVRNQAMQNFGPTIHAVYKKAPHNKLVMAKIADVCRSFYDLQLLRQETAQHKNSFSGDDDSDKIKEMWAYHLPCVLLILQKPFWPTLRPIYSFLLADSQLAVKKSLASSLLEVATLHLDEPFLVSVLTQFSQSEIEEVQSKVVPNLIRFIRLVEPASQMELLANLVKPLLQAQSKTTAR